MRTCIEYHPSLLAAKRAVTLVAHGLNLKPAAMLPLVHWLTSNGSDVYLVKLSGHHIQAIGIEEVTLPIWQEEMLLGYEMARKAALFNSVPLYFLGYSFGALLGQSAVLLSKDQTPFDRQVLIAPAFALRKRSYLIKFLFFLNKRTKVPSYTPKTYKVNEALPLSIYKILYTEVEKVVKYKFNQLNIPTLILVDPKDELISYKRLLQQVRKFGLTNYQVVVLDHQLKGRREPYHHLVIDAQTMGDKNWELAAGELKKFLFAHSR